MLDNLTKEQEAHIPVVRDKFISYLNCCKRQGRQQVRDAVNDLYEMCGLKKPLLLQASSPFGAQLAANISSKFQVWDQVWDQVKDQVWGQVGGQVWDQVKDQVEDQVWDQVKDQVGDQVKDQVWGQVGGQVWDQVKDQVEDQVWDQVEDQVRSQVGDQVGGQVANQVGELKHYPFSFYGRIDDACWCSFYQYFIDVGAIPPNDKFTKVVNLLDAGIFTQIQFKALCITSELPLFIHRDDEHKMHSVKGPAIQWSDGWALNYLHGVFFEEELHEKICSDKISIKDILSIENIEQRMVALKTVGIEKIVESRNAKLLDSSVRGNELYLVTDVFSEPAYFLKYKCPSTDRVYVSGIDPEVGIEANANSAMAWKFSLDVNEYDNLAAES